MFAMFNAKDFNNFLYFDGKMLVFAAINLNSFIQYHKPFTHKNMVIVSRFNTSATKNIFKFLSWGKRYIFGLFPSGVYKHVRLAAAFNFCVIFDLDRFLLLLKLLCHFFLLRY